MKTDTDKLQRDDEEFAARVGEELRNSAERLDAATLSRLNRARQVALDGIERPATGTRRPWLSAGAAAGATALVAVVVVTFWQGRVPESDGGSAPMAVPVIADEAIDFELLFADGDLAMYEELEFFAWLPEDELENSG